MGGFISWPCDFSWSDVVRSFLDVWTMPKSFLLPKKWTTLDNNLLFLSVSCKIYFLTLSKTEHFPNLVVFIIVSKRLFSLVFKENFNKIVLYMKKFNFGTLLTSCATFFVCKLKWRKDLFLKFLTVVWDLNFRRLNFFISHALHEIRLNKLWIPFDSDNQKIYTISKSGTQNYFIGQPSWNNIEKFWSFTNKVKKSMNNGELHYCETWRRTTHKSSSRAQYHSFEVCSFSERKWEQCWDKHTNNPAPANADYNRAATVDKKKHKSQRTKCSRN